MSINDGLALIRRHDFEGALPLLAAEVRKRPDDAYAAYYLAYAFVGAQDPQPAVTLLAKITEVHPGTSHAPASFSTIAPIAAAIESADRMNPKRRASRSGALEKLTIPSNANLIILRSGYFVLPA